MRSGSSSYSNATLRGSLLVAGEHPVEGPVDLRVLRRTGARSAMSIVDRDPN